MCLGPGRGQDETGLASTFGLVASDTTPITNDNTDIHAKVTSVNSTSGIATQVVADKKTSRSNAPPAVGGRMVETTNATPFPKRVHHQLPSGISKAATQTVKEGRIEIQGDKREEVARILTKAGFTPVIAGG